MKEKSDTQRALEALTAHLAPVEGELRDLQTKIQRSFEISSMARWAGDSEEAEYWMGVLNENLQRFHRLEEAHAPLLFKLGALRVGALSAREVNAILREFETPN